jgi:hypothetical protein
MSIGGSQPRPALQAALALGLLLLGACADSGAAAQKAPRGGAGADVEQEIGDLVRALTPLPATAPSGEGHAWFARRKQTLERLRAAGPEVGRAALQAFADEERPPAVRGGLLDVAAHAAPEETRTLLVELVTHYGADLGLRKEACLLLGETAPETALAVLEPILLEVPRSATYPPDDALLDAWIRAAQALGRDQGSVLAAIATDTLQSQEARHRAAKGLGEFESVIGRSALEHVLVESGGNNYLRRVAAQSLRATVPPAELCPRLEDVLAHEADQNFAQFLDDLVRKTCP